MSILNQKVQELALLLEAIPEEQRKDWTTIIGKIIGLLALNYVGAWRVKRAINAYRAGGQVSYRDAYRIFMAVYSLGMMARAGVINVDKIYRELHEAMERVGA